jgi:hypothetical protein
VKKIEKIIKTEPEKIGPSEKKIEKIMKTEPEKIGPSKKIEKIMKTDPEKIGPSEKKFKKIMKTEPEKIKGPVKKKIEKRVVKNSKLNGYVKVTRSGQIVGKQDRVVGWLIEKRVHLKK